MSVKTPFISVVLACWLLFCHGLATPKREAKKVKSDVACSRIGGICQRSSYVCAGRYLKSKCAGPATRQCCLEDSGAWDVLCSGHHSNRVRGCDKFGCGHFNSKRGSHVHKAVDIVCDDYTVVHAPFTGMLRGRVQPHGDSSTNDDGVELSNSVHCVKIFNIRPSRYKGFVSKGESLGYVLPMQEKYSGITSHLHLQMCDKSDPTPYI
ncbi:leukocyte cell-derived chemotaxin-2-like [Lepisosteus oculatus]|uniref:leukocyte cell-derived chemotaxin-2-like n=1 Tax=Lepisosteus oculatus TaxID=7918 RepID=UPI0035F511DF